MRFLHFPNMVRRDGPLVVLVLCTASAPLAGADTTTIIEAGRPRAVLVLAGNAFEYEGTAGSGGRKRETPAPGAEERAAAEELQSHLRRMSGATLEIAPEGGPLSDRIPIYLGAAADPALDAACREQGTDPGSFALAVRADRIEIRGLSPAGTRNGVCELLEQLGVRWFMPGQLGTVIPRQTTVRVRHQRTIQTPSFPARRLQGVRAPEWETRMRLGGPYFPASHGAPGFGGRESARLFEEHPEYFSLIDGQRKKRQLCVSNPDVLEIAVTAAKEYFRTHPEADILGIGANDGRGFCECESCRALDGGDYDPFGHSPSMTDRYIWFFNCVREGLCDEFPDKRLGFYAYSVYNRPPVKVKPDPHLVPAVALITLCRLHGMANPVCPEKSYEEGLIRQWGKLVPEVYYRGYWFNLADPGLPFFMIDRLGRDIPLGKKLGIAGWRVEAPYQWAGSVPSRYIACKLMWDHTADVDELMQDFYKQFFGPAAAPARRYVETMSKALATADYHTGSSWDMPHIYDEAVRERARAALEDAARLAPEGLYAERVRMYAQSLDYLDAFAEMLSSRAQHDFVASKNALDRMEATGQQLAAGDPPLIGRAADSYLHRFFAKATLEGYQRTTRGNRLVAPLSDIWRFQIDPEKIGEAVGWQRPGEIGGNWRPIKTSTLSWSSQGLRYYKGLAWYRQRVAIPEACRGEKVLLWIGGVDESARVWVNGRELKVPPSGTFAPFEMDATEAIQPGRPNSVVVCVDNSTLNELGTGGITGPVMFYAPASDPSDAARPAESP